jgi:hypothetical protein
MAMAKKNIEARWGVLYALCFTYLLCCFSGARKAATLAVYSLSFAALPFLLSSASRCLSPCGSWPRPQSWFVQGLVESEVELGVMRDVGAPFGWRATAIYE